MPRRFVDGIVGVSLGPPIVKCGTIVRIEWEIAAQPFREVRIDEEMPTECDEIGITFCQDRFGARGVKTPRRYHGPSKQWAKLARRYG